MTEIVTSQTPPMLHGPSEKDTKYDRQLRLWAAEGQAALESANLLLLNSGAGAIGTEALKNLVLPGIGRFTIVDGATVKPLDLGVNFFLDEACLDRKRSQCCAELLQELNPDVQGDYFPKDEEEVNLDGILKSSPTFTLIMYTLPISPEDLAILEAYGKQHQTPLVAIHCTGFYSYFRIDLPGTIPVIDTHPESERLIDLRLTEPWPELEEFADDTMKDVDQMDDDEHGHIPYVVILLHQLRKWNKSHDGKHPLEYKEKLEFRRIVADASRVDKYGGIEENYQEAVNAINRNVKKTQLDPGLSEIFEHELTSNAEKRSGFWVIASAMKKFYQEHGVLPLSGSIPDMKAKSDVYVKLQGIYKNKAWKDASEVFEMVRAMPLGEDVNPNEVDLFCKNASFVRLVNARPTGYLADVMKKEKENDQLAEVIGTPLSLMPIYLALSATAHEPNMTADEIKTRINTILPDAGDEERIVTAAKEVSGAMGTELHNIAAVTGGMVAQEVIKIITKQYIPIDNVCIFDGMTSRCQVLRL